jgi:hypothetical protein|tara:strand:+ start:1321 stop:1503 length:183 start_codon:yes stop_codon:yes gene_type:complete
MNNYAPIARVLIRYIAGIAIGAESANILATDTDLITVIAILIGGLNEMWYYLAKKKGWNT